VSDDTTFGAVEQVPTERHHCMISTCSWYYETAARMTYTEAQRAVEVGDLHGIEAGRDRLLLIDTAVRVHLETHLLLDWATEVHQLRARLDEIGETREEWGVRTYDNDDDTEVMSSLFQARDLAEAWRREISGSNPAVKVRTLQSKPGQWREVPDA
jgi:hypothetical protein